MPAPYTLVMSAAHTGHYLVFARAVEAARQALWQARPDSLVVDLRLCRFLEPGYLVTLACLVEEFQRYALPVSFVPPLNAALDRYLHGIRLYEYWQPGFDRRDYVPPYLSSALNLWQVSQPMIDSYAQQASRYFSQNHLPGRNLDSLSISLAELFNNICDHARSPVQGYCLTQYYPAKQQLIIAVCDFGVGIPASINTYWQAQGKARLADSDALRLALRRKVTTKSTPRNRGFGLANLSAIVRSLGGHLFFLSNFATLKQNSAAEWHTQDLAQPFGGSLVVVTLNTATLPDVEEELSEDEFSF